MNTVKLILGGLLTLTLIGCASAPAPLYSWGSYPQQSYLSLSVPDKAQPMTQIGELEKDIEKAKAKNAAVPPGLYAHLGWLNLNVHNAVRAAEYFELERQVYPESTVLMDRLLNKIKGPSQKGLKK